MITSQNISGLRKLAQTLKPLSEMCDELDRLGGIEVHEQELVHRLTSLNTQIAAKKLELENASKDLSGLDGELTQRKEALDKKVKDMLQDAETKASAIVQQAEKEAKGRLEGIEKVLSELAVKRDMARKEATDINNKIAASRVELSGLQVQINDIKADLKKRFGL